MNTAIVNTTPEKDKDAANRYKATKRFNIALELADYIAHSVGLPEPVDFFGLPQDTRGRMYELAERAIQSTEPDVRVRSAAKAVMEIEEWIAGSYMGRGTEPTALDIAREAIARFCAIEGRQS